jgi:hypothetical protein
VGDVSHSPPLSLLILLVLAGMSIYFYAPKPPATVHPRTWAPMEYMHEDDEFVYTPKAVRPSFPLPQLRFSMLSLGVNRSNLSCFCALFPVLLF